MKTIGVALLGLTLVAGLVFWYLQGDEETEGRRDPIPAQIASAMAETPQRQPSSTHPSDPDRVRPSLAELDSDPAETSEPEEWALMRDYDRTDGYRSLLNRDLLPEVTAASLGAFRDLADRGDAEAAYLIYLRYITCLAAPRTEDQLRQAVAFWEQAGAEGGEHFNHHVFIERETRNFTLCAELEGDFKEQAFEWFTRATEMGYLLAQIDYAGSAPPLLQDLGIRDPGLIDRYRGVALEGLRRALESGHVAAFNAWAAQYLDGNLVSRDPFEAYAWAHTAELASHGSSEDAAYLMQQAEIDLSPGQVREARTLARGRCERYCR